MDKNKILFVTCVNNEELYESCVNHIKRLHIPENFSVQILTIRSAKSMAEAYNQALENKAKYKIYLHQDTFILNHNIIFDIIQLFESRPKLGLIGVAGCKLLPKNGIWWHGDVIGKGVIISKGTFSYAKLREPNAEVESVEAVDGLFIATQYDIPWRADIPTGFHFYDTSQSLEFIKRGYQVGVPRQKDAWCLHYHKDPVKEDECYQYLPVFLKHYDDILNQPGTVI